MAAIPYLKYESVSDALDWLATCFGFTERERHAGPDGMIFHAEMSTPSGDPVYLGGPGGEYRNPKHLGAVTVMVNVDIDDVDALFERATAAGAKAHFPPTDTPQGMRVCKLEDLEGHEWFFARKAG